MARGYHIELCSYNDSLSLLCPSLILTSPFSKQQQKKKQQQQPSACTLAQKGQQEVVPLSGDPADPGDDGAALGVCY